MFGYFFSFYKALASTDSINVLIDAALIIRYMAKFWSQHEMIHEYSFCWNFIDFLYQRLPDV